MLTLDKLNEKGFQIVKYEDGEYYSRAFTEIDKVENFYKILGEDSGQFDYDFTGVRFIVETKSDFSFSQYLFSDQQDGDGSWFVHDELSLEEFEELLNQIQ